MIINIRVDNFRSFENETSFSMVPSYTQEGNPDIINVYKNVNVLRFGLFYGANSSGKTNLIKAVSNFKIIFAKGFSNPYIKNNYCRNHVINSTRPTLFEITFSSGNKIYTVGMKAILAKQNIVSEWVDEISASTGRVKHLFKRDPGIKEIDDFFPSSKSDPEKQRIAVYMNDLLESKESFSVMFLSDLCKKNYDKKSKFYFLKEVRDFFFHQVDITFPNNPVGFLEYASEKNKNEIDKLLNSFHTGIAHIHFKKIDLNSLKNNFANESDWEDFKEDVSSKFASEKDKKVHVEIILRFAYDIVKLSGDSMDSLVAHKMTFDHFNCDSEFNVGDESDGTNRLLELFDMIFYDGPYDKVFFVDELERSLHPVLLYNFIELFKKSHKNKKVQLIFSTHETYILDQALFRRDEVWFVEKDLLNSSKIYSLDIFKERYDKKIDKAYLDGRYGAIPIINKYE